MRCISFHVFLSVFGLMYGARSLFLISSVLVCNLDIELGSISHMVELLS